MAKVASWQCACARFGHFKCDWPTDAGKCGKSVCRWCARKIGEHAYCPFHRGDPPEVAQAKVDLNRSSKALGEEAATEAARILGVPK